MDQIEQTLEPKDPAKPLGAIADSGLKPAAQLSFAEIDGDGQAGHRPVWVPPHHPYRSGNRGTDQRVGVGEMAGQHVLQGRQRAEWESLR
jgi:hypothetical protein